MAAAEPASSGQPAPQGPAQGQRPPPAPPAPPPQLGAPAGGSSRHEKSLGLLTAKFVSLLQEAQDGVLDLKAVSAAGRGRGGGGEGGGEGRGGHPARAAQRAASRGRRAAGLGVSRGGRAPGPQTKTSPARPLGRAATLRVRGA